PDDENGAARSGCGGGGSATRNSSLGGSAKTIHSTLAERRGARCANDGKADADGDDFRTECGRHQPFAERIQAARRLYERRECVAQNCDEPGRMTIDERLEQWEQQGTLSREQHAHLAGLARGEPFSLFLELNLCLYAGIVAFIAGLGWTVTTWSQQLGDVLVL